MLTVTLVGLMIQTVFQAIAITKKENAELKLKANKVVPHFEGGA
jgi:hypothetical protein